MRSRRRLIAWLAALFGVAGLVLLAFGAAEVARDDARSGASPAAGPARKAAAGQRRRATRVRVPAEVRAQAAAMTRAQQVAQLFLVGFEGTDATVFPALRERGWGGLLLTAANAPSADVGAVLAREAAVGTAVPPLVAASGIPGFELPAQSPDDDPEAAEAAALARAQALRAAGITLVLAPVADVGIGTEEVSFGDDPARVARLARAAVRGWRAGGVVAAPGRFPGEGAISQDPLEGPATVGLSREELAARDLRPFRALRRSARALVVSSAAFSAYDPVTPAALTPAIVRDLLRRDLGFTGVAISHDLAGVAAATGGSVAEAAVEALRTGIDMVQIADPADAEAAYRAVLAARIPRERLREALLRVLALKRLAA